MKRWIYLSVTVLFLIGLLAGCNSKQQDAANSDNNSKGTQTSENKQQKATLQQILLEDKDELDCMYCHVLPLSEGGFAASGYDYEKTENHEAEQGVLDIFDANGNRIIKKRWDNTRFSELAAAENGDILIDSEGNSKSRVLLKVNKNGEELWKKTLEVKGVIHGLTVLSNGNIAFVDFSGDTINNGKAELWILSSDGTVQQKQLLVNSVRSGCFKIAPMKDGGFVMVGTCTQKADTSISNAEIVQECQKGNDDGFVTRFSSDYEIQWVKGFGGTGYDNSENIAIDNDGDIYTVFRSNTPDGDFKNVVQKQKGDSYPRIMVKLSSSGEILYKTALSDSSIESSMVSIIPKEDGAVLVHGSVYYDDKLLSQFSCDMGKSASKDNPTKMNNFILTIDSNGKFTKGYVYDCDSTTGRFGQAAQLKDGRLVTVGNLINMFASFGEGKNYSNNKKSICIYNG